MNLYRFSFSVDEEIKAETKEEAWKIVKDSISVGYYGPTQANVEFLEEIPEPAHKPAVES